MKTKSSLLALLTIASLSSFAKSEKIDGKNNEVSLTSEIAALRAEQKSMQNKIAELETSVKQLASAERSRLQAEIELLSKQVQNLNAK